MPLAVPASCGDDVDESDEAGADTGSSSLTDGPTTEPTDTEPTTNDPTTQGSMTMSGSDTDASSTTSSGCATSEECSDPDSPICVDMQCVPCTEGGDGDAECAAKDANAPACRDDGQCVQCTSLNPAACVDTTPVCDGPSSVCTGCTYHEQCAGTACDIATGACFTDDCVVTVDGDAGAMADYEDIMPALADGCVVIVHELDGAAPYLEALVISNISIALLAADGEAPIVQGIGGNPSLSLTADAHVYVQGLEFTDADVEGIAVDGASVYLDRAQLVQNTGGGMTLTSDAYAQVRSCFIGGAADVPALVIDSSTANIVYSTLGGAFDAPALSCADPMTVTVRNSIIVSRAVTTDLDCNDATITFSATEVLVPGTGNVAIGSLDMADATAWFADYNGGNFSLTAAGGGIFADVARWRTADPAADPPRLADDPATAIDDQPRPSVDDTPDHAGADLPD